MSADRDDAWVADAAASTLTRVPLRGSGPLLAIPVAPPTALADGAGGVWVVSQADRVLQEVNPAAGRVVRTVTVGNGALAVATGAASVWVADSLDGEVVRIDPAAGGVQARIAVSGQPVALVLAGGAVWVADAAGGQLQRIDPSTDRVTDAVAVSGRPSALSAAGGRLWMTDPLDGTASRLDPTTGAVLQTIDVGGGGSAIATGAGAVWVDGPQPGQLTRVDPARGLAASPVRLGARVIGLSFGGGRLVVLTGRAAPATGGTLVVEGVRGTDSPAMADPGATYDEDAWQLQAVTNDGLLAARKTGGAAGAELVPDLAVAMPLAGDGGLTWTFRLRRGLRYSTGQPVRASDVLASFERLDRLRASSETAGLPELGLVGEDACIAHPSRCDLSFGVVVDDSAGTVVLHLSHPQPDLLLRLASPSYFILPAGTPLHPLTRPPFPATGPYQVTRLTASDVVLDRNRYFRLWSLEAQPPGLPDRIVWRLDVSPAAGLRDVLAGRADVLSSGAPAGQAELLATRYPTQLHLDPLPAIEAIFLDASRPPFSIPAARQAAALAVDRRRLAADEGPPATNPVTCQILSPGIPGYQPFCPYPAGAPWRASDVRAARRLIAASGAAGTQVLLAAPPAHVRAVSDFARALRAIGLRARLTVLAHSSYYGAIAAPGSRVQAGWAAWIADAPDPTQFFDGVFTCAAARHPDPRSGNISRYCDAATDTAIAHADAASGGDPFGAATVWSALDARVTRAAPWIPFANYRWLDVVSRRARGYVFNPLYSILLDQISVRY